jgi:hypothetical protein
VEGGRVSCLDFQSLCRYLDSEARLQFYGPAEDAMMSKWSAVIVTCAALLLASGCKKEDSSGTGPSQEPPPPELVGTWVFQSGTLDGNPVDLAVVMEWVDGATSADFTVGADGTYSYRERDAQNNVLFNSAGTFSVSGQSATITTTSENGSPVSPPEVLTGAWALNGDQLSLTYQFGPSALVVVAVKSGG